MTYAGVEAECKHGNGSNCTQCIVERREREGTRGPDGRVHGDNGGGYCYGCPGTAMSLTVPVRFCPVLNTPEQIEAHRMEDHDARVENARLALEGARRNLRQAEDDLLKAMADG